MPKTTQPNILCVLLDDVPSDIWTNTAGLQQLIAGYGGNWLSYPNATLDLPSCGPSRASAFSGQRAAHTGVLYTSATGGGGTGADFRWEATIWRLLRQAGYQVFGGGKLLNSYSVPAGKLPGGFTSFNFMESPGYFNYTLNVDGVLVPYGATAADYSTDVLSTKAQDFITRASATADPWCVFLALNSPHADGPSGPEPAPRHSGLSVTLARGPHFNEADITDKPAWLQSAKPAALDASKVAELDTDHVNSIRALRSVDEALVAIINLLTSLGELDNTIILIWGDNGHLYGEHRLAGKGVPYEDACNMRLRVRWPGAAAGTRPQLVSNIDIASTLADLAGIDVPWAVDGMSFVPTLTDATAPFRRAALTTYYNNEDDAPAFSRARFVNRSVTLYTVDGYGAGAAEGYNLAADPYELAATVPDPADLAELQALIALL
jgi:N-acetylglucosamine-6-sulfatase